MADRVLILGAGIIGLSSAWHALRRGFRVTVVDRGESTRDGCSFGNAGMVVPSHFIPLAAPGVVWQGIKWMWNPESPFYIRPRLSWDLLSWGLRFWWASSAHRVRAAAPILRDLNFASRAIYEEWNADVSSGPGAFGLETKAGEIEAEQVVLAAGSWSPLVARRLGLGLPMQAGKGYSVTLPSPRKMPRLCSILTEARVAVTPMGGKLRVGGTMELSGLSEEIAPARVRGIQRSFCRYYQDFKETDFEGLKPWKGLRPCSPDGLPYLGRSRKIPNLVIATGHAMMGLSLGPVTGKLVGELLDNAPASIDLSLLAPERYG